MSQNWHVRKRQDAPGAIRLRQLLLCSSSAASSESVVECSGKSTGKRGQVRLYLEATAPQQARDLLTSKSGSGSGSRGRWS